MNFTLCIVLFSPSFFSQINWAQIVQHYDWMNRMRFISLSIYIFYIFFICVSSPTCFRRSNKITSVADERWQRTRKETETISRAHACYTMRQADSKFYLTRALVLLLIVLDDRRYAQKNSGSRKKNMLVEYSFPIYIYNSIIREKQQLRSFYLQQRKKKKPNRSKHHHKSMIMMQFNLNSLCKKKTNQKIYINLHHRINST